MEREGERLTQQNKFCQYQKREEKKSCLNAACVFVNACVFVRVFSYKRMCSSVCLCAHLTVQSHDCMRQCHRQLVVLQQKAERVCGGEIRTARLLQGLALPAQRQTQVRQTSFDVSTE